ncbi:flagellar hook-associated protein FlgK [Bacillus xiapuensis]|uniref:flagellar hook-associated protein FlgK n=1 Tax=Bacillus xiapuensis TaxID=2014075 RepID=UPI000C248D1E|nr:flagellar hook-associated protein FlgK [Bacillus xiapuensis]
MRSTFFGLETAKRAMFTQQSALYTTGHNISNANTPGYTRQRVNFQTTLPYPAIGMNRPGIPGQMGTGVEAGSVQRVRDNFIDMQFRGENNKLGYWQARAESLSKMEDIMNEPSKNGLSAVMGEFWQSLQDLSVHPENIGAREVVLERGEAVIDTFEHLHSSLSTVQKDLGNQISVNIKEINSLLDQISDLNRQIGEIEPHGYLPNDLYDQRDRLVDQLSQHVNIQVETVGSGGHALDIAEGIYNITMLDANGQEVKLITGTDVQQISVQSEKPAIDSDSNGLPDLPDGAVTGFKVGDTALDVKDFTQGKLRSMAEAYGYQDGSEVKGLYPRMLDDLDKLAYTFATMFNNQHKEGYGLNQDQKGKEFFDVSGLTKDNYKDAAKIIAIQKDLDPEDIAASQVAADLSVQPIKSNGGNGKNAIELGKISSNLITAADGVPVEAGSIKTFFEGVIGRLGVEALKANRLASDTKILTASIETNRQSISSVSLDEEMTNLIKYQHAYNAAARNITVVDEMLDKIINGMGVVGR